MKILVADDNRSIPKKVTEALKDQGYEILGVGHGEAAVKKMPEFMPDLVLADVFMPVRNGYEVCEFVKNDQRFAHIPVVLLVGAFDPIDQHEVKRVRADGLLKKPFDPPGDLLEMVKTMLEKSVQARPAAEGKPPGPKVSDTVELSATEMKGLVPEAKPAAPTPEPEVEEFSTRPARIEFGESTEGMSFGELLEAPAEAEAPKVAEEAGPREAEVGFRASSVPEIEFAGEKEEEEVSEEPAPPVAAEAPAWGAVHAEPEAALPAEAEAPPETPQWGGIEVPAKEPSPDEPPIKVEFESSEPVELVLEEPAAASASVVEAGPLPELASTPDEFMAAAPLAAAPAEAAPEPEAPAAPAPKVPEMTVESFSIPSMEEMAAPPAPEPPPPPPPRAPAPVIPPPIEIPRVVRPPEFEAPAAAQAPPAPFTGNTDAFARPHVNPADVDAIVEKVIARLQKGVLDQITRDILRPIIEALVAREIQNKQ